MDETPVTDHAERAGDEFARGPVLPCIRFGHEAAQPGHPTAGRDAYEQWREVTRVVFDTQPRADLPSFYAASAFYQVDGLIFAWNSFSACMYTRDRGHVRSSDADHITLHMPLSGGERGVAGDTAFEMRPGRITLQDWAHRYSSASEATTKLGLVIPRNRLEKAAWIHTEQPVIEWDTSAGMGLALFEAWQKTWHRLSTSSEHQAPHLSAGFLEVLNAAVADAANGRTGRSHHDLSTTDRPMLTFGAMKVFIDDHLHHPALGADMLAEAFHCSRATIYRHFEWPGGVTAYIRDQRLARCFTELASSAVDRRARVHKVAERWGFHRASHFARIFKERYGRPPSAVAQGARRRAVAMGKDAEIEMLHAWFD
ncbi:MAG: helix-turn-helix domain-containing protein [Planctomycetota bacterium]